MPIYEYECKKCGRITEALQGFNDPPLKRCKHCKGKLEKLISLSSFQLQGTGWYATDYNKGPGIPPHANDLGNSGSGKKEDKGAEASSTDTASPSSDTSSYEAIKSATEKARSKSKGA